MHLATGRSRPNPIRSKTKQNALTRPAERSGRLLERISNDAPRGMTVRRQNPAYRPTCMLFNRYYDFLEIFAFLRFRVGLLRFLCKSFSIFLQRLPCSNEIRRNDECSLPFLKQSRVLILQLLICPASSLALKKKRHRFSYILQTPVLSQKCCTEKFGRL